MDFSLTVKKCSKCGIEKTIDNFGLRKSRLDSWCKQCYSKKSIEYYKNNKDKCDKKSKEWTEKNKEKSKEIKKRWKDKNRLKIRLIEINKKNDLYKNYYNLNTPICLLCGKKITFEKYLKSNGSAKTCNSVCKSKLDIKNQKKRYKNDINFKLRSILNSCIKSYLKRYNTCKKDNIVGLTGCTIPFLRNYLESQFTPEMNWGNKGIFWDIDHIIPSSLYDLTIKEEQKKCFNWRNLRPLPKIDNIKKSNNIDKNIIKQRQILDLLPSGINI